MILNTKQLEAFHAVASAKSFEQAAKSLSLTPSAVSQRVKALERAVGAPLLVRGATIELTEKGQFVFQHAQRIQLAEQTLLDTLNPHSSQTTLTSLAIAVNADTFATWWRMIYPALLREFSVLSEMLIDDQEHTLNLFNKGRVMGCVTSRPLNKEGIQNQLLGYMHYTCVAHPDFAQQHFAQGLNIHAMQNTPAVVYDRKDQLHEDMIARIFQIQHMTFPKIFMPSPECFLDAIVQKCGYGMMPLLQIESELQVNSLIDLTPKHHHAMPLYWCYWSNQAPLYEHLTQYIMAQGSVLLEQDI